MYIIYCHIYIYKYSYCHVMWEIDYNSVEIFLVIHLPISSPTDGSQLLTIVPQFVQEFPSREHVCWWATARRGRAGKVLSGAQDESVCRYVQHV